ncbi:unnamed protein product, partial [Staurois parvus]
MSVGEIVPHHWYQWMEKSSIIVVSDGNNVSMFISVGGIVLHICVQNPQRLEKGKQRAAYGLWAT